MASTDPSLSPLAVSEHAGRTYRSMSGPSPRPAENVPQTLQPPARVTKGCFLVFYGGFSIFTTVCISVAFIVDCVLLIVATVMQSKFDTLQLLLRLYLIAFNILAFFCEMEWTEAVRTTSLLQSWELRGLFYAFIGLFLIREFGAVFLFRLNVAVYIVGCLMTFCGVVYTIMGMLCLKRVRNERTIRYIQLLSQYEVRFTCLPCPLLLSFSDSILRINNDFAAGESKTAARAAVVLI